MRKKHFKPEQIVTKLREAEVEQAKGTPLETICKNLEIAPQTYYRWRKEYGNMKVPQTKRLKELEKENSRLKRLVADQALDKAILKDVISGKL